MSKLGLIFQREFLTRVKKKSFLLTTLLTPLGLAALMVVPALLAMNSKGETKQVVVVDESGLVILRDSTGTVTRNLRSNDEVNFTPTDQPWSEVLASYEDDYEGALYIPPVSNLDRGDFDVQYYSNKQLSLGNRSYIERRVADAIRDRKVIAAGLEQSQLDRLKTSVTLQERETAVSETGEVEDREKANTAGVSTGIAYVMAFIIYIIMLVYGGMVMRSVMEEKTNRIVEVIISSVKPFELMMGKILGVSAVGLLQLLLWIILIPTLATVAFLVFGIDPEAAQQTSANLPGGLSPEQTAAAENEFLGMLDTLRQQNWGLIIPMFIIYFLGGYFIYASLFAAVGSAAGDDIQESQQLTLPIMLPIIIAIVVIGPVIDNPDGPLAFWMSMIPLFSPVIMPARIPFEPPMWEIALSVGILIASAIGFVWIAARIYRVGILLYGKKVTFKELGKWLFYKN